MFSEQGGYGGEKEGAINRLMEAMELGFSKVKLINSMTLLHLFVFIVNTINEKYLDWRQVDWRSYFIVVRNHVFGSKLYR